jgi:ribosomal protein L14E/L6E/L27E
MGEIALGRIVYSKAGRDKGRFFIIVGIVDEEYVLIADGDLRKISEPKKKKLKHLVVQNKRAEDMEAKLKNNLPVIDAEMRKCLQSIGTLKN